VNLVHLLSVWSEVIEQLKNASNIMLMTDYDGTLTPIVERPEKADLPVTTRILLKSLGNQPRITLGVISGRSLADLKEKIGLNGIIYAGNHGLEMEGPNLSFVNPQAEQLRPIVRTLSHLLTKVFAIIEGIRVEDKGLTLSIHYREVAEGRYSEVRDLFDHAVSGAIATGKVRVTHGKKVFEIKPDVRWNKGKAIQLIMKQCGKGDRLSANLPIYLGDDVTDEDGFAFVEKYGQGITIFVGAPTTNSIARYYLNSTEEVDEFLGKLLTFA
jgi:trehalose 6-phosphate phosphatase